MKKLNKIAICLSLLLPSSALFATGMIIESQLKNTQLSASSKQVVLAPAWDDQAIYLKDDKISYQQKNYIAKWWSKSELPTKTWTAWQSLNEDYQAWSATQPYPLDARVIFGGKIYQSVYFNQGQEPLKSGAWEVDHHEDDLVELPMVMRTFSQTRMESTYASIKSAHTLKFPAHLTNSISFSHWNQYLNGELINSQAVSADIDGQFCQGLQQCTELLNGNEVMIQYPSIDLYSTYRIDQYLPSPTGGFETVRETNSPFTGSIELCNNNVCLTYKYQG